MHLLVPRSRSSTKVKVKYKGYVFQKMAVSGAFNSFTNTSCSFCDISSRFIWANGRAAGIGITIPVCSIGRLPLLEPLPSLPNIEWKRQQSFRYKMAEAANETSFEEFFFFNLTFVFVVKYKSSCLYLVIRLLILRIHFGVVNIW